MKTKESENSKPKLKVVFDKSNTSIVTLLSEKFDVVLLDFKSLREYPDLVVFTGGADVDPELYNEARGKYTMVNKDLDNTCLEIFHTLHRSSKFLGICRGSQFLTAMSGGSLIQHVSGHTKSHDIILGENNETIEVTSTHHQMLYPYTLNDKQFNLLGWSKHFNSETYLNGKNQEWKLTKKFLEPEIVYYKNTDALAIQGHPEFPNATRQFKDYTLNLVERLMKGELDSMEYTNPYNHIGEPEEIEIPQPRGLGDIRLEIVEETTQQIVERAIRRVQNNIRFSEETLERNDLTAQQNLRFTAELNQYRIRLNELNTQLDEILNNQPQQRLDVDAPVARVGTNDAEPAV